MTLAHRRLSRAPLAALISGVLVLSACSSGDEEGEATDNAAEDTAADDAADDDTAADDDAADDDAETGDDADATDDEAAADEGTWPRTIEHEAGTAEIPEEPTVIVSTSITLTGTLLAIDAPVTASAATGVGPLTDDQGFFAQWGEVAQERGVEVLYPNLELDIEAIEALEPDLIIGSTVGADSAVDAYDQLNEIAPTIMLDYGSNTWEDLAVTLGEATGSEAGAEEAIADFDAYVAEAAESITIPGQPATALAYNGADGGGTFSAESSQAAILTGLGFEYYVGPEELADEVRSDVSFFTAENLPSALSEPQVIFVIAGGDEDADALLADPLLANIPAVTSGNVVPAGATSFRIDFYSGMQMIDAIVAEYGTE